MAKKLKIDMLGTASLVAGGYAGSQVTSMISDKVFDAATPNKDAYASLITLGLGIVGKMFTGPKIAPVFDGMIACAGSSGVGALVNGYPQVYPVQGLRSNEIAGINVRNYPTGTVNAGETGFPNYGYATY